MAMQKQPSSRGNKNEMIECDYCGELYSSTYRNCPFCDESRHPARRQGDGSRSGATSRGRRVAKTTRGGGYGKPAYLSQIIFWVTTLALILGACWVVSLTVGPLLNRDKPEEPDTSITQPSVTPDVTVPDVTVPDVTVPDEPDPVVAIDSIKLSHSDVTLQANKNFTITPTIAPADADVTVLWSTDSNAATVSLDGVVTNTNTGNGTVLVTITATAGDKTAQCIVRCKPGGSAPTTPTTPTTTPSTSSNKGTISGAGSGLNVRSGAGTSYDVIASLNNGTQITIVDKSISGWYKISFYGVSGVQTTGYISRDFVTFN